MREGDGTHSEGGDETHSEVGDGTHTVRWRDGAQSEVGDGTHSEVGMNSVPSSQYVACSVSARHGPPPDPPFPRQAVAAPHLSSDVSHQEQLRQLLLLDAHPNLLGGQVGLWV